MSRTHGGVYRRAGALVVAAAAAVSVVAVGTPASASSPGSAYASNGAVFAQPGFMVTTNSSGILAPVNWLTNGIVSPLVSSLTNLSPTLGVAFTDALVDAGLRAIASTSATVSAPATGFPDSCAANGWNSDDCYGPETPDIGDYNTSSSAPDSRRDSRPRRRPASSAVRRSRTRNWPSSASTWRASER